MCVASMFIRNSGTEDKMAIYLRGVEKFKPHLEHLSEKIYPFLLASFKNKRSFMAQSEKVIVNGLKSGPKNENELRSADSQSISYDRLFHEIHRCSHIHLFMNEDKLFSYVH